MIVRNINSRLLYDVIYIEEEDVVVLMRGKEKVKTFRLNFFKNLVLDDSKRLYEIEKK